ncbi:hypothetical protein [Neobacillus drentensis]|uniref:hypothetical protein n=1 Tax=Neobacillus drentensis TaxID=220684 RepID=UPI0030037A0B
MEIAAAIFLLVEQTSRLAEEGLSRVKSGKVQKGVSEKIQFSSSLLYFFYAFAC